MGWGWRRHLPTSSSISVALSVPLSATHVYRPASDCRTETMSIIAEPCTKNNNKQTWFNNYREQTCKHDTVESNFRFTLSWCTKRISSKGSEIDKMKWHVLYQYFKFRGASDIYIPLQPSLSLYVTNCI